MDYWLQLHIEPKPDEEDEVETNVPKNWLQNNNPMLLDIPEEQFAPNVEKSHVIFCDELKFGYDANGFVVKSVQGDVSIKSGDVLDYQDYLLTVSINKTPKSRQHDVSVFDLPVAPELPVLHEHASALPSTPNPTMNDPMFSNPLAFLGGNTPTADSGLFSTSLHQAHSMNSHEELATSNNMNAVNQPQQGLLQSAFSAPNYSELGVLDLDPYESVPSAVDLMEAGQFDVNLRSDSLMYDDMKEKNKPAISNASPLDELDQSVGDYYEQSAPVAVSQPSARLAYANSEPLLKKLKRKLWG